MDKLSESPLGWEVDLLYLFAHCSTKLVADIDQQLKAKFGGEGFVTAKKKQIQEYEHCIRNARVWFNKSEEAMEKFGLDTATFEAVDNNGKRYTNVIASANELIRACMLVIDRGHCVGGDARVFKRLRSLPEQGVFPEWFIERFKMKYEIVPEKGDRIHNANHGDGTLDFHTGNGNWNVKFDNGDEVIINEKQFTIL